MKSSLNARISVIVLAVVVAILISFGAYELWRDYTRMRERQDLALSLAADRLADELWIHLHDYDRSQIDQAVGRAIRDRDVRAVVIRDAVDNSVISAKMRGDSGRPVELDQGVDLPSLPHKIAPIRRGEEALGTVAMYFTDEFLNRQVLAQAARRGLEIVLLLGVTVVTLLAVLSRNVLRPLLALQATLKTITQGNLDERIDTSRRDEIGSLATSFARMQEAIREKIAELGRRNEELAREIRQRARAEEALAEKIAFLNLLNAVTTAANEAGTLNEALAGAVEHVLACTGWPAGFVRLHPDRDDSEVVMVSMAPEDADRLEPLRRAAKEYPHPKRIGAVQDALAARKPVWTCASQAQDERKYPLMPVARRCGVGSVVSLPVLAGDEVPAVLSFALDEDTEPDDTLMTALADVGVQLGRVAERARAETALRASEEKFRAIFNQTFQLTGMLSVDGLVLAVNETALRFAGIAEADVLGKPFWETPWWNHSAALQQTLREAIERAARGELVRFEAEHFNAQGELRIVDVLLKPILDPDGTVAYLTPEGHDITELRRAGQEIRRLNEDLERRVADRTAELKAANEELEAFTYSVSHDLRAPLRHIDGFTKILLDEHGARMGDDASRLLGVVRDSASGMGVLIDDLLTLSRLGRKPVERVAVDCNAMVGEVWHELTADRDTGAVEFDLAPLPPARADVRLLRQVWRNLLDNALKYSSTRQQPRIRVFSVIEGGVTWYHVEDNGVGFDPRYAGKLFGVFQRLHRPEEFPGTGVGLAIVQRIVRKHGGKVRGQGELDRGAAFEFALGD